MSSRPMMSCTGRPNVPSKGWVTREPYRSMAATIDSFGEEFSKVSLEERSSAMEDLHGVAEKRCETPDLVATKSKEMTLFLDTIAARGSSESCAYRKAVCMSTEYVEGLKPRFLRAENFNSQEAANRMVRFFDRKLELFGEQKLAQDITMKDLTVEENEAIRKGLIQLLPHRDRAGRAILFIHGQTNVMIANTRSVMRTSFYFVMAALQDAQTQSNGTVLLYYGLGQESLIPGRTPEYSKNLRSLPFRVVSVHYCRNQKGFFNGALSLLSRTLKSTNLVRFRFHIVGTHMEALYNLMTFGIPREAIPLDDDGYIVDLSQHCKILSILRYREENMPHGLATSSKEGDLRLLQTAEASNSILIPDPMDILLGRGRHPKSRPGALRLHNLLIDYKETYENAGKAAKTRISKEILQRMKQMGSRFLVETPCGYRECEDDTARHKIAHGFRNLRLKYNNPPSKDRQHLANKRLLE